MTRDIRPASTVYVSSGLDHLAQVEPVHRLISAYGSELVSLAGEGDGFDRVLFVPGTDAAAIVRDLGRGPREFAWITTGLPEDVAGFAAWCEHTFTPIITVSAGGQLDAVQLDELAEHLSDAARSHAALASLSLGERLLLKLRGHIDR
ncbi:hypothetical protein [Leifsonia sp. fls2-241-R2A-40a]|uniref:hypothetical protein n=1 Tax=Leifsonia sp. fls2-241-R2A-40a TaxID=3040290 RepID=UPI00254E8730|nr:hypothetical protein [Leifsonia sp. fls2-241-R2A-40a]